MKSSVLQATLFALAASAQDDARQPPAQRPVLGQATSQGCYSMHASDWKLVDSVKPMMLSAGACQNKCMDEGDSAAVFALAPNGCWCGSMMPSDDDLTDDDNCDYPCPGYAMDACGGIYSQDDGDEAYFSVYNMGVEINPSKDSSSGNSDDNDNDDEEQDDDDDSSSSSSSSSAPVSETETATKTVAETSVITTPSETPTQTDSGEDNEDDDNDDDEEGNGGEDGEGEGDNDEDMGTNIASSMALVAAIAGGSSLWFLL